MQQNETRNLDSAVPAKTCKLKGRDGRFMLVRMGPTNSRVANLTPPRGSGFKVKNSELEDIQGVATIPTLALVAQEMEFPADYKPSWFPYDPSLKTPFGL